MKIREISIENVMSYNSRTVFRFQDGLNILIGPNGSGKSNLQKIVSVMLSNFFIFQYEFQVKEDEATIERVEFWKKRDLIKTLSKFDGNESDQIVELTLVPEASDIANIKRIRHNLEAFKESLSDLEQGYAKVIDEYLRDDELRTINAGEPLTYRIENFSAPQPSRDTAEGAFLHYLQTFFIYKRLASRVNELSLSSPVFFFFSERTFDKNVSIKANQIEDRTYYSGYQSAYRAAMGDNTNLVQWGLQHYARILQRCILRAANEKDSTVDELTKRDPDVILLDRYVTKLGYEWGLSTSENGVNFHLALKKGSVFLTPEQYSSGEKEIIHFLLAMFSLNVLDGLVVIDEPELHLHPRWQKLMLTLFSEISDERNCQFIIATHSGVFVQPETLSNVIRLSRDDRGSKPINLNEKILPNDKNRVRMINSQNNERLFFSDKILLVEGLMDRIVFEAIVSQLSANFPVGLSIDVLDVGGKHNFIEYETLIGALNIPYSIIADLDYVVERGTSDAKINFLPDAKRQWAALAKDKKSTDGASMIRHLQNAIENESSEDLELFWNFFRSTRLKLSSADDPDVEKAISAELARLADDDIHLLRRGAIEEYLPDECRSVAGVLEFTNSENWHIDAQDEEAVRALFEVAGAALGLSSHTSTAAFA